jgi:hypothetical protein
VPERLATRGVLACCVCLVNNPLNEQEDCGDADFCRTASTAKCTIPAHCGEPVPHKVWSRRRAGSMWVFSVTSYQYRLYGPYAFSITLAFGLLSVENWRAGDSFEDLCGSCTMRRISCACCRSVEAKLVFSRNQEFCPEIVCCLEVFVV